MKPQNNEFMASAERNKMSKIFVGNIPHGSSEIELQAWVESHGFQVESAQIIRDRSTGLSRGFGFVALRDGSSVDDAILALNGQRMIGRILTVNHATPITQPPHERSEKSRSLTPASERGQF
jgi:RNA recognition motif-containing protein